MPKKTFFVMDLIDAVNTANRQGKQTPEQRQGHNSLLEKVLHDTGNYSGFSYLGQSEVPAGEKPGIIFDQSEARDHEYPDDSRRVYLVALRLRRKGE